MQTSAIGFSEQEVQAMLANLDKFSEAELEEIYKIADTLAERKYVEECQTDLIKFVKHVMPSYIVGKHHKILSKKLSAIESGILKRLCVNIAPRHGKSQLVSTMYPAWFLGKNPAAKVMLVSHTADLAVDFGRKVRDLIDSDEFQRVFPGVQLSKDNKSAGRWTTTAGGEFFCCGIGAKLAGRGADLLLIDDPHSEQDVVNGNSEVFDKAYSWFAYGARTRLMPGGRIAIVQCMTGDTPVLLPNGLEKPLADIRPGDRISTWDNGVLTTSRVLNHKSNGVDSIYTITTTCGKTVRANERHPFLVQRPDGAKEWVRLKNLQPGDSLVALKDVRAWVELKQNPVSAPRASHEPAITGDTLMHPTTQSGIMGNIKAKLAVWMGVMKQPQQKVCATPVMARHVGQRGTIGEAPIETETHTSNTGMVYRWKTTIRCWLNKMANALYVNSRPVNTIPAHIGTTSCVLTTATTPVKLEHYCATIATSRLGTQKHVKPHSLLQNTSRFIPTTITSIEYAGEEEVFDVQIERTENFIANGLVSHNTRWHADDLTGRVVRAMAMDERTDQYEVIEFPAILNENTTEEKALWPEFFDLEELKQIKSGMPVFQWNAQYQQNPTGEEAAIVKREWWQVWTWDDPPECEYLIMSLDSAAETNNRADFTSLTTWGVFMNEETDRYELILLNAIKERYEFPQLKDKAYEEWLEWKPDCFIVEKKSSGVALFQELRRTGIPLQEFTPHRGTGDKLARLNSVADIIRSGMVWVPQSRWAEDLVEEIAAFPFGSNDDQVDSTVMALMRFRNGGFIRLPSDLQDEPKYFKRRRGGYY